MKLTPEQRDDVADDAATRYRAGESWAEIAARNCLTPQYVYRLTVARHNITFGCSRQAIRTAIETAQRTVATRYPRISKRRAPSACEISRITGLYESCPQAPRNRDGSRAVRGPEGRQLAEACRTVVDDGVPMSTLSVALGRGATWVHWLLGCHDLRPEPRPVQTTSNRTRC